MSETAETTPSQQEVDLSGRQLGNYNLLRRLGRGAMAEVYLAEQLSLRRQVALKVLKPHLAVDEVYVKRFHNEAQAAASLVHANIVQIYEVGCIDGLHFIAQEYVAGLNLRELVSRRGPPSIPQAVAILRQAAAALGKAAEQGIVHRDIKPENIMISKSGEVKVADFGLARLTSDPQGLNLTQVGITMGTPLYMSPEQVEGRVLDPRSDMYSLGVTCYHMLAGEPPFRGDTALAVAVQHLNAQPERLETHRPDLPTGLCRIVHRMLAKNPADRYASARELLRELRSLQIAGFDGEATTDDDWPLMDLADVSPSMCGATQQLDALMKTQFQSAPRGWKLSLLAGTMLAFVVGGSLAWSSREHFMLASDLPPQSSVPRAKSAKAQLEIGRQLDSEEGYKAVAEFFPDDASLIVLARRQLAIWSLRNEQYSAAQSLFDDFADAKDLNSQAFGLAGQTVIAAVKRDDSAFDAKEKQLKELSERAKKTIAELLGMPAENNDATHSLYQFYLAATRDR